MFGGLLGRRGFIAAAGGGVAGTLALGRPALGGAAVRSAVSSGNVTDGAAGANAAFGLGSVRLRPGPFLDNQSRNTGYLHFVDPDRLLRSFRLNVGLPSTAQACGGWESPTTELRGHST